MLGLGFIFEKTCYKKDMEDRQTKDLNDVKVDKVAMQKQQQSQDEAIKTVKTVKTVPEQRRLTKEQATPIRMPPEVWGPIFWNALHIASLAYTDTPTPRQKTNMKNFYESMVDVIPCPICRHHYEQNLKELPIDEALNSHMGLITWVWTMHNKINVQLDKREFTFDEFIASMKKLDVAAAASSKTQSSPFSLGTFSFIDGLLLGTGVTLLTGVAGYYLYQEGIRKSSK